jgi:chromosome segregation ATPase
MSAYVLLNSGGHIALNAGGAVLLNTQDAEEDVAAPLTYGGGHITEQQVHDWWDRIDRLRAENRAKEEAQRETESNIRTQVADLAELQAKRSRSKKVAAERAALRAEINAAEHQVAVLRAAIDATLADIDRIHTEMAAAELARLAFVRRRNAALALLLLAA